MFLCSTSYLLKGFSPPILQTLLQIVVRYLYTYIGQGHGLIVNFKLTYLSHYFCLKNQVMKYIWATLCLCYEFFPILVFWVLLVAVLCLAGLVWFQIVYSSICTI